MAYSPNRKTYQYASKRETYTQNRQENVNQFNLNQHSPTIRSPVLNEESDYTNTKEPIPNQELGKKLEIVLRHNSHLLNENATLSQMLNNLRMEMDEKVTREQAEVLKANNQLRSTIEQMKIHQELHEKELQRLLDEISRLHEECYRIETEKNTQIKKISQTHEKQMTVQVRNLKKSAEDGREILQLQIRKLKQSIQLKNFEYESLKTQTKGEIEKLRHQNEELRTQNKHFMQLKQIQVKELYNSHKQNLQTMTKQLQRQNMIELSKRQNKIKKLKQEVIDKNIQIQQAYKKVSTNSEEYQNQIANLRSEKQRLIEEINQIEISTKENFEKEKRRVCEINELEKENMASISLNEKECLQGQIQKLMNVCEAKTQQIRKLYHIIGKVKQAHSIEKKQLETIIEGLRKKLKQFQENNLEDMQTLKVKMGQLHQADVSSLEQYYENEIVLLSTQVKELEQSRNSDREKIHQLLQKNDQLRKTFDIELTKYKAKIQDYKVKFAAAHLQFREQITSLGTKMQLTSQTLLREAEQKQKGAQFFEAEKKKFYSLIEGKDRQISGMYQAMQRLKNLHAEEIEQLRQQVSSLRESLDDKSAEMKDFKRSLEEQFERKSEKILAEYNISPDQSLAQQNVELRDKIEKFEKDVFKKDKQIQFLQKQIQSLRQEVGLHAGFLETMQLESSAAIQDEKTKLKVLMGENEVAMKDYYETKLESRDRQNEGLKKQLEEKQSDIRQLIIKYRQVEKKLKQLLEAQQKLSGLEEKIVHLGLDQNLVKNLAELFIRNKKSQ